MWVDPRNYTEFPKLIALNELIRQEYALWKTKHDIYRDALCVYGYEYESNDVQMKSAHDYTKIQHEVVEGSEVQHARDWWAIGLYYDKQYVGDQMFPGEFTKSTELLKSLPGIYQCIINFVTPNGKIPYHLDTGSWERIQSAHGMAVKGYTAVLAIDTPTPNSFSFQHNPDVRQFNTGDVYAFDGRYYSHQIENFTDQWRVTCVVDIAESQWTNVYGGTNVAG